MTKTQLAVVGGGPGGYTAAFLAADLGLQVTLIEPDIHLGGVCLNRGCIPSKTLLHVARTLREARELAGFGVRFEKPQIEIETLRKRLERTIGTLRGGLTTLAARRNVRVLRALATLIDSSTLSLEPAFEPVSNDDGSIFATSTSTEPFPTTLGFDHLILATGSAIRPAPFTIPANVANAVWDSTAALELREVPPRLLVVGAGFVGLELAAAYASLGSRVHVIESQSEILPSADTDLVRHFERLYTQYSGIQIERSTEIISLLVPTDESVDTGAIEAHLRGAAGVVRRETFDRILVATGREPVTSGLGLEKTRVVCDRHGFIEADTQRRTAEAAIFAIGDCTSGPMLAHRAIHEAKIAVAVLSGGRDEVFEPLAIPGVVYADPELAWAGETERSAAAIGRTVETAAFPWAANGRSHAEGSPVGITKWIFDPKSQRVIGAGIVGCGASELIGEAVLAIEKGATVHDLAEAIHPHPTRSETFGGAAEAQLGTATDLPPTRTNR